MVAGQEFVAQQIIIMQKDILKTDKSKENKKRYLEGSSLMAVSKSLILLLIGKRLSSLLSIRKITRVALGYQSMEHVSGSYGS